MRTTGASITAIGKEFSIGAGNVWDILKANRWGHVIRQPNAFQRLVHHGDQSGRHKITTAEALEIHRLYRNGVSSPVIAAQFSLTREHVWSIVTFKSWAHLKPLLIGQPAKDAQTAPASRG
jgi:hypothetical protein